LWNKILVCLTPSKEIIALFHSHKCQVWNFFSSAKSVTFWVYFGKVPKTQTAATSWSFSWEGPAAICIFITYFALFIVTFKSEFCWEAETNAFEKTERLALCRHLCDVWMAANVPNSENHFAVTKRW